MADYGRVVNQTANAFSFSGLNSLANVTYVAATAVDFTSVTPDPDEVIVEVALTPGSVSGLKQARVYLQTSVDGGTNYTTGPTSGTTTTDDPNLKQIGVIPLGTSSTLQRDHFPVMAALGFIPSHAKLVIFNESGAALAGSGNSANWYSIKGVSA